ncbi:hypothetical protein DC431_02435 [Sphingomonas melonis]|nr:hypothetical protein DC425_18970 [Sphingomonas sp. TPD3009]PVE87486.1 hypothetical protein DC431_02435 [Sphingomonas melonis]
MSYLLRHPGLDPGSRFWAWRRRSGTPGQARGDGGRARHRKRAVPCGAVSCRQRRSLIGRGRSPMGRVAGVPTFRHPGTGPGSTIRRLGVLRLLPPPSGPVDPGTSPG